MAADLSLLQSFADGQGAGISSYTSYAADHDFNYAQIQSVVNTINAEIAAVNGQNAVLGLDMMVSPSDPARSIGFIGVLSFAPVSFLSSDTIIQIPPGKALGSSGRLETVTTVQRTSSGGAGTRYIVLNGDGSITVETTTGLGVLDLYSVSWTGAAFTPGTLTRLQPILVEGHDLANSKIQTEFGQTSNASIPAYEYDRLADRIEDLARLLGGQLTSADAGQAALNPIAFSGSAATPGLIGGNGTTYDTTTGLFATPGSDIVGVGVQGIETMRFELDLASNPAAKLRAGTSLTNPPLSFIGDPNTGLGWVSADRFNLIANSTAIAQVRGDVPELFLPVRLQANLDAILGDPGLEANGISVNGTTYDVVTKISEIGAGLEASLHYHKHSDTIGPVAVSSRSRGTTSSHTVLQNGDELFRELITGRGDTTYEMAGYYRWVVDSTGAVGAIGDGNMPARFELYTTPPDSDVPALAMTVGNDQVVDFENPPTIGGVSAYPWSSLPESIKTGTTYTQVAADRGTAIIGNNGSGITVSLLAVATAADDYVFVAKNIGAGSMVLDPNSSETIEGAATLTLRQGESAIVWNNGSAWRAMRFGVQREVLLANRDYYVRSDGSDSNDGLSDSSGGAFLTLQKAIDVVAGLDLSIYSVTINISTSATYAGATVSAPFIGGPGSSVTISGDTTTPTNVVMSSPLIVQNFARVGIEGVDFTTSSNGIEADSGAVVEITGNTNFGACSSNHIFVKDAFVLVSANYTIDGGAFSHWQTNYGGYIRCISRTITLSGTPAFNTFAYCANLGRMEVNADTFSGSATGIRYRVDENGVINTAGGGATYFPGDTAAAAPTTGGQYI